MPFTKREMPIKNQIETPPSLCIISPPVARIMSLPTHARFVFGSASCAPTSTGRHNSVSRCRGSREDRDCVCHARAGDVVLPEQQVQNHENNGDYAGPEQG